jgi:hypothetical protein
MGAHRGPGRSVEREAFWRGHIEAQAGGVESVRGYCRRLGLSEAGFHHWRRELKRRAAPGEKCLVRLGAARVSEPVAGDSANAVSPGGRARRSVTPGQRAADASNRRRAPVAFAELAVGRGRDEGQACLEVVLGGRSRRLLVRPGFDEETLGRLVAVLERGSC